MHLKLTEIYGTGTNRSWKLAKRIRIRYLQKVKNKYKKIKAIHLKNSIIK